LVLSAEPVVLDDVMVDAELVMFRHSEESATE
jgi:hypothetical protein